jgi:hypothetical protein
LVVADAGSVTDIDTLADLHRVAQLLAHTNDRWGAPTE